MGGRKTLGKTINWLHLSDLHVFAEANTTLIIKSFEKLAKKVSPHFIVISGDFRHKKENSNFEQAKQYLENIIEIFGVEKENVFLVPGNHDVNNFSRRHRIITEITGSVEKKYDCYSQFMDRSPSLNDGFRDYINFVKSFYDGTKVDDDRIHNPSGIYCISWKNKLNLFHINTALISEGGRTHSEIVDVNKIAEIAHKKIDRKIPTIMIGHHGLNSLYPSHRKILENILRVYGFSAYLHGDIHVYQNEPIPGVTSNTSFPEIACGKSAPQAGDDYSDIGVIYYSWKEDDNTYVFAYQWRGEEFTPNTDPIFVKNINEPYYFPMIYEHDLARSAPEMFDKIEQAESEVSQGILFLPKDVESEVGNEHWTQSKDNPYSINCEQIDELAQQAYDSNSVNLLAQAILSQSDLPASSRHLDRIYEDLIQSNHKYPLAITGEPGTGKSSLLSLIFLKLLRNQAFLDHTFVALIDLHFYDNRPIRKVKPLLREKLDEITASITANSDALIFVDGINEYKRRGNHLQKMLLRKMAEWDGLGARFVLSIGTMNTLECPLFIHSGVLPYRVEKTIQLKTLNPSSKEFSALTRNILRIFLLMPRRNKDQNERVDKFISCCKKLDGNEANLRTVVFLAKRFGFYSQERDGLFSQSSGRILLDYYSRQLNTQQLTILAWKTAEFMLGKAPDLPDGYKAIPYRSAATRDFLFAFSFVDALKNSTDEKMQFFDCVLTPSINRFVIDLILEREDEVSIAKRITELFSRSSVKVKSQLMYLLGRVHTEAAKSVATNFLCSVYTHYRTKINYPEVDADEVLLFRSIGISLIYLGTSEYRNDFFSALIYNKRLSTVNRNFHIAYYTMPFGGINNEFSFNDNSVCTLEKIRYLYSFLHHSIENTPQPGRQCINIITMVNLVIQDYYNKNVGTAESQEIPAGFLELLDKLAEDVTITDAVVKEYVLHVKGHFTAKNIYARSFEKFYQLKEKIRAGWLLRGREIPVKKTPESVADHSWACCFLAQIILTEHPEDCEFMSDGDLRLCRGAYNKDKIIQMLLIHDLPEVDTGDIPTQQKNSANEAQETEIMKGFGVLGAFPFFGQFRSIADLWEEYHSSSTINALIAKDIDHLEPLVQLYVYRDLLSAKDVLRERNNWVTYANNQLHTDFGRTVFRFISENLLTDDQFVRPEIG